jgi:hypothetical protein
MMAAARIARVTTVEKLHAGRQVGLRRLHVQMLMVIHQHLVFACQGKMGRIALKACQVNGLSGFHKKAKRSKPDKPDTGSRRKSGVPGPESAEVQV